MAGGVFLLRQMRVVDLDQSQQTMASYPTEDPQTQVGPENLAYVMYTSGSTGRPKGVSITHRNVIRLVISNDFARFSASEVFLQFAPVSFDASTFEIWAALLNGGRLLIVSQAVLLDNEAFVAELRRHGATILFQTTSLFNERARAAPDMRWGSPPRAA